MRYSYKSKPTIKLWIDDLVDSRRPPPGPDWKVARTSAEAIAILRSGLVAEVSFDHDFGGPDNAMLIFDWLDEKAATDLNFPIPIMSIHSMNPVGVERIRAAIEAINRRRYGE